MATQMRINLQTLWYTHMLLVPSVLNREHLTTLDRHREGYSRYTLYAGCHLILSCPLISKVFTILLYENIIFELHMHWRICENIQHILRYLGKR